MCRPQGQALKGWYWHLHNEDMNTYKRSFVMHMCEIPLGSTSCSCRLWHLLVEGGMLVYWLSSKMVELDPANWSCLDMQSYTSKAGLLGHIYMSSSSRNSCNRWTRDSIGKHHTQNCNFRKGNGVTFDEIHTTMAFIPESISEATDIQLARQLGWMGQITHKPQ